ncbi:MAG: ATP-binding protein [Desulfotalea sp.]
METSQDDLNIVRKQKLAAGAQPFKLVKFFSFSSLFVILAFTLFLSWAISKYSEKVMVEQSEAHTEVLAESINQQVFYRFVVPTVLRFGKISLREPKQYQVINVIITGLISGMNIDSVNIYDSNSNVISYSTVKEMIGKENVGGSEYEKARKGEITSQMKYTGNILNYLGLEGEFSIRLVTYIPFRQVNREGESRGDVLGVIEIEKDLTAEYSKIIELRKKLLLLSSVIMAVLFFVLRMIVARADKIMLKQTKERLKLEDNYNQAKRLAHLGTMVATVSHEIKSPLGIVRSTAEILEKRIKKIAPGNEQLANIIVQETTRLNDIVLEFLDFARPQKMSFHLVSIDTCIEKIVNFVKGELKARNISLVIDLAPNLKKVSIDENAFYRALLNIVMNAIQAMDKDGGTLQISTGSAEGGEVVLTIRDTGVGISEENLEQIFAPFFTNRHKGTGLGLAITMNIIENHGGKIEVESQVDIGTSFILSLPRAV